MKKYKVTINWYNENRVFYTHSSNPHQALENAISQLSKASGMNKTICRAKTLSGNACWNVEEIKKEGEDGFK